MPDRSGTRSARGDDVGNRLIAALPAPARARLRAGLHPVVLRAGQLLFQADAPLQTAYFPERAVVALLARSVEGDTLEVGLVGRDGIAGLALIPGVNAMPYDAVVQIGGAAWRVEAAALRSVCHDVAALPEVFGRYAYSVFAAGVQTAVCNNFHPIPQRCARWLLTLHDLVLEDEFPVTQNLLALMLGVRRPTVTLAAHHLQQEGIVDYRHGRMRVRNRRALERAACACYGQSRDHRHSLLGY